MHFGSFAGASRLGCFALLVIAGTAVSHAQFSQSDQSVGNSGTQQSTCSPGDPTCQTGAQDNGDQTGSFRSGGLSGTQQLGTPRGVILSGEGQQNNGTNNNRSQQQRENVDPILPLDSPTEFQHMVANSTGRMLPIYGAHLFRRPPSTFAPVNQIAANPDYVIGPGDELLIQIWGQVTLNTRLTVDRSGSIYVPQVGTIHVAGLKFAQLQDFLKAQVARVFKNYDLNVNMGQLRSMQVFVVGQARRPGSYTISSLSTLTNALFETGGPTPQGSLRHIQLKRSGKVIVDFDLYDLLLRGDKSKDEQLLPGDVIYIPPVGPQVAVAGSVNVPAIYELKSADSTTIGDVLEIAAGLTNVASKETVRLERVDERRMRSMTQVTLDASGRSTILHDGDLLELVAVVDQYKDAVTLRGNVANPGRYMWKPGMRIRDLLPDRDALITRDYWLKRSQLGQPMLTYIPTCQPQTPYGIPNLRYGIPAGEEGENPNWRYSSTRNPNLVGLAFGSGEGSNYQLNEPTDGGLDCIRIAELDASGGGINGRIMSSPQTNAQGVQNPSNSQDSSGQQTNAANNGTSSGASNSSANRTTAASASVGATVTNSTSGQFRARYDVKLSEPDIDWSYAVIERQSKADLTTSLLPFNLGKTVLEEDPAQNLELLPGDVVTIFSKADIRVPQSQQTRFVRLEGEFISSGVYSVLPGETLRQLVQRAGGLSPEAYLYGSEFTRESTRRVQQQRLNEYIDQIELQASTNATSSANRSISAQDSAATAAALAQNQNIITSLRQARASGRIVLNLPPESQSVAQLPDLPLEDGDRFIIPRIPSTVSVDGAVYNQNSFLYDESRRVGSYIKLAGGVSRDADKNRAYVIRADGSVISKQYTSSLRGGTFNSVRLNPGDTIVIPLNLTKGQGLRTIVDIAQIVGQFGIAIAATSIVF